MAHCPDRACDQKETIHTCWLYDTARNCSHKVDTTNEIFVIMIIQQYFDTFQSAAFNIFINKSSFVGKKQKGRLKLSL